MTRPVGRVSAQDFAVHFQRSGPRGAVISTTDVHALNENHHKAIHKALDENDGLQEIGFVIETMPHNLSPRVKEDTTEHRYNFFFVVDVRPLRAKLDTHTQIAEAIFQLLYTSYRTYIVTH